MSTGAQSLTFHSLEIRRMPGFAGRDGFLLQNFASGINVIYGPNGSGKSTCLRALCGCIWPTSAPGVASLRSSFEIAEQPFLLDLDSNRVEYQRAGKNSMAPDLPPPEIGGRYRLSLDELLQDDGRDFSAVIARESAGGYSLEEACANLGWDSRTTRPATLLSRLSEAQARVREAEGKQRQLRVEAARLEDLEREILESREAAAKARRYELLINHKTSAEARDEARRRLDAFDSRMALLAGNELQILTDLRSQLAGLEKQRTETLAAIRRGEKKLAELGFSQGGLAAELISEQRSRCTLLQSLQAETGAARRDLAQCLAARDNARQSLGDPAPSDAQLRAIETKKFGRLADFARRVDKLRAEREAQHALSEWLGSHETHAVLGNQSEVLSLLRRWLAAGDTPQWNTVRTRLVLGVVAGLTLGCGLLVAILLGLWGLALAAAGALLAAYLLAFPPLPKRRDLLRQEFLSVSARQPETWTRKGVEQLVAGLVLEEATTALDQQKAQRWAGLAVKRQELEQRTRQIEKLGQEIRAELGVVLAGEAEEAQFFLFAERLLAWQSADSEVASTQARLDELQRQHDAVLSQINDCLAAYGKAQARDYAGAAAGIDELDARSQEFLRSSERLQNARDSLAATEEQVTGVQGQVAQVFKRVELTSEDEPVLQQWLRRLPEFREAEKSLDRAEHDLRKAESEAEANGILHLAELHLSELELRRQECKARANRIEELLTLRTQIDERLQAAKASTEIQTALSDLEHCREELVASREQETARAIGALLVSVVGEQTRTSSQPAVLRRAAGLFSSFTHHHWRLDVDSGADSGFRAIESATGRGYSLDEISKGTRLQLLLAVRLAFVEEQERGCRLPLFLDETLGNSDESRAELIISTLLQLAAAGRQLFYVTAQADEVSKWRALLDDHPEIDCTFIDLGQVRHLQTFERAPLSYSVTEGFQPVELPWPSGVSREEYGLLLQVPELDPFAPVESVHLWYVVEDLGLLRLLQSRFLKTWGHLKSHVDLAGFTFLSQDQYRSAEAGARAIETACRLWRNGRGKPVDRATIVASGLVSSIFLEQVCVLVDECGGNAAAAMAKLATGAVPKFREKTTDRLRGYLEENGFLDNRPILGREEMLRQLCAASGLDISQGLIEPEALLWILNILPRSNFGDASRSGSSMAFKACITM
jgi:uncharacterized protein YhaN